MSYAVKKKIALVAPNWLGDAVMSLPLVGLLGQVDDVSLSVLAPEYVARVYWGLAEVDELTVFERGSRINGIVARARTLRSLKADAAVLLPPSFSSAVAPRLAGVNVRVGFCADARGPLLTDSVSLARSRDEHLSKNFLRLGKAALDRLGVRYSERDTGAPSLCVNPAELRGLDEVFAPAAVPRRFATVVPGAAYGPAKSWPWERYREVVRGLSSEIAVVLAGGAGEREIGSRISSGLSGAYNLCGQTSLGEFFALLSRSAVLIANDSGSPHVAASLGVPVVVLFGSTSPTWTAPLGDFVDVVRAPVHCSPCFRKTCPTRLECFENIDPGDVLKRALTALGKEKAGAFP